MILRAADQDGREVSGRGWETSTSRARSHGKPVSLTMRDVCAQALHQQQALVL